MAQDRYKAAYEEDAKMLKSGAKKFASEGGLVLSGSKRAKVEAEAVDSGAVTFDDAAGTYSIDWSSFIALFLKYGPQVWAWIKEMIAKRKKPEAY